MASVAVAVASVSLHGCYRSSGQTTAERALGISYSAINKHYNNHAPIRCYRSSHNTKAIVAVETNSSTIDAANLIATSSSERYQNYDRLLPCPSHKSTPRVEHLVVSEGGTVLEFICKSLHLPPLYVADLIQFGAVHYALVCPPPPPNATEEQIRIFKEVTEPSVLRKRASIKGKTVQRAQKTFRITSVDQFVEPGMYIRVHVHPKRFPRCYEIDWRSRIIAVTELYVVLDKPAGTSIRAQFAACKAPLIGDSTYMAAAIAEMANPGLNPFGKYNKDFSCESEKETAVINWIAQHGNVPSVAIGLQACQISWDDDEHFYKAGLPWWRSQMA